MLEPDDDVARAQTRIGTVLRGKYRLDRVLGIGGMAVVYAATHLRNANRVAVKVLHRELSVDAGLRARFLREGYAANTVEHPGTVRVLDDDVEPDGTVFLVMELLDGETLEHRWERARRKLGIAEVITIISDVLDVLVAAHAREIVHRDLKPENLFVTRDKGLRVLDFGVARLRESSPTRTKSGAVFGTPAFMPPEQALGRTKDVGALSDIWAVGATAFTLLSGRYVHAGETAEEMLVRAATLPAPLLAQVDPRVPEALATVIDRALSFERRDRWQSAAEMKAALLASREQLTETVDPNEFAEEDGLTRVAPPPAMTFRPRVETATALMPGTATALLPTLAAASTIAGVATTGARRMAFHRKTTALVAAIAAASSALVVVVVFVALEMARAHEPTTSTLAATGAADAVAAVARRIELGARPAPTAPLPAVESGVSATVAVDEALVPPQLASPSSASSAPAIRTVVAAASPTASVRPPPAISANPNCTPPYEVVNGIRRWKKACL